MSNAREEILGRIRNALAGVPGGERPQDVQVPRDYRAKGQLPADEVVALFARRTGEYRATVRRMEPEKVPEAVARACRAQQVRRLVVPPGFPESWLADAGAVDRLQETAGARLSHQQLDQADGVITTCALAVAQTGTIVLDGGPGQGRRALTLLPDYHLCVVRREQIVELIPEAFARTGKSVEGESRPVTFISGPSATSDIELSRVEGVHGPRRLEVLIVEE